MYLPDLSTDLRVGVPPLADGHIDMTSLRENTRTPNGRKPRLDRNHPEYPYILSLKDGANSQMHQSNVDWLVAGNVRIAFLNGFTQDFKREGDRGATEERGTDFYMPTNFRKTFDLHNGYYEHLLDVRGDVLELVTNQTEFAAAKAANKIAVIRANEGCEGATLDDIAYMRSRGVTSWGVKWNDYRPDHAREIGVPTRLSGTDMDTGLTPWGVEVVKEITSNGGTIDISHASDKTALDIIEHSRTPVVATHSMFRAEDSSTEHMGTPSKRNLPQYLIDALWANEGAMGIPGVKSFSRDWQTVINFLKYMGDAGRLSMVRFGTDMDGTAPGSHIPGFDNSATLSTVAAYQMRINGFSNDETFAVLYGNMDRDLSKNLPK